MGSVYRCFDETFRRLVAIKTLRCEAHLTVDGKDTNTERFKVEAGALARLVHPRIVATHDFGVDERRGEMFLVMQYVDGPSLDHRLREGPLPIAEALRLAWDIADALAHAHDRGVVHRDVKPDNVLLNELGEPMLTDFGLALLGNFSVSDFKTVAGTINYMAPEQILCPKMIGFQTDQYGLGAVLHQMLTCAFEGSVTMSPASVLRSLDVKRPTLDEAGVDAPVGLQQVISKMLEREPDDRFPDDQSLLDALHEVGQELDIELERAM
jgi:serine/threonine-protein kinase